MTHSKPAEPHRHHYRFGSAGSPDLYRGVCIGCGAIKCVEPEGGSARDWKNGGMATVYRGSARTARRKRKVA